MSAVDRPFASSAARRAGLTWLARIGFAGRGLVYVLVGAFAAAAALGLGKQPHGLMDAVQAVTGSQLRLILAAAIGIGLACLTAYFALVGTWKCLRGQGSRRWLFAGGMLGDAVVYGAVMISVLGLLVGWQPDGEREAQVWTVWLFAKPFGRVLVGAIGFLIVACGVGVVAWVVTTDIDDDVDLPEDQKRFIEPIGRCGLAGRGVGILLVGIYWVAAAIHVDPSKAHELGGALEATQQHATGWLLLLALAVAFIASAVFDFVEALYHRPEPGVDIPGCSP